MNRITKTKEQFTQIHDAECSPLQKGFSYGDCVAKLAQLENIEDELGIDLIKAVKLCKQVNRKKVIYTKEKWGIDRLRLLDELDIELFNHRLCSNNRGVWVSLDLHKYGKIWALTREELL